MAPLAKQTVQNKPIPCVVPECGRWESSYIMPRHVLIDKIDKNLSFTEQHGALWEVVKEDNVILEKGRTTWGKELAATEKGRKKTRLKGKRQKLKSETRLQRDNLASADHGAEQATVAKLLNAGDKVAA